MRIGMPELLVLLVVVMLIFGVGKLPEMGASLGKAMREFKRGMNEIETAANGEKPAEPASQEAASAAPADDAKTAEKKA